MPLMRTTTRDVDVSMRYDFWREVLADTFVDLYPKRRSGDAEPFAGELTGGQIGDVRLCTVTASPHEVERTPGLIRRTGGDYVFVSLLLHGSIAYEQEGRLALLEQPGQMVLYDSAKPYQVAFTKASRQVVARFPRDQITRRLPSLQRMTAFTVGGGGGVGGLASGVLQSLSDRIGDVDPLMVEPLLVNVVDLVTASFRRADDVERVEAESRLLHLARARECIRRRFADPLLTPAEVAREIGVSERYLYLLFQAEGTTPARTLMDVRLETARRALVNQSRGSGTMESLALAVGFKQASHFTRAFKDRFGMTPRDFRRDKPDVAGLGG